MTIERKEGRLENFFYQSFRNVAGSISDRFFINFKIREEFGLTQWQEDIFKLYFASYVTSKNDSDMSYTANKINNPLFLNMPVLGAMAKLLLLMNDASETVSNEYKRKADLLAAEIKGQSDNIHTSSWIRGVANSLSTVYTQNKKDPETLGEEIQSAIERIKRQKK